MKLADLSPEVIEKIKTLRYDRILEKHEGPWKWASVLEYYDPELMLIDSRYVLLPLEREQHPNISVLRSIVSADGNTLTLFLKDTTYYPEYESEMDTGRLAICEKLAGADFYITTVYHEWFVVKNDGLM
ncbi:MAG: hypothetical protein HZC41_20520 [Chloroflexi bacterium]|nr:hypothetical protein [Chloroflexota bacterium]